MKKYFNSIYSNHKNFWTKKHIPSLLLGFGFLVISMLVHKWANGYVSEVHGVVVPDLILDHIPTYHIDLFIIQGALFITGLFIYLILIKPQYFIFSVYAFALFTITRSFFICLTHLGVSPGQLPLDPHTIGYGIYNSFFNTQGDFFFSGHTGTAYLMALILWKEKFWRYFFIILSIIFGASVLLAHIHYSIDVFAAPFMTYGVYIITARLFKKDYEYTD